MPSRRRHLIRRIPLFACAFAAATTGGHADARNAAPSSLDRAALAAPDGAGALSFESADSLSQGWVSRGNGYAFRVSSAHWVAMLREPVNAAQSRNAPAPRSSLLRWQLLGARSDRPGVPEAPQAGVSHYLVGSDAGDHRLGVRHYGAVRFDSVYPGIDVRYHGDGRSLEYDFIVNPGASASSIQLELSGADGLRVTDDGDLSIATEFGELRQSRPKLWQDTPAGRRSVDGHFILDQAGARPVIAFAVGDYDPALPLVIDPVVDYSTFLGGNSNDTAEDVAIDADGNSYVVGETYSSNFPVAGAYQGSKGGNWDAYIAKYAADGTLLYATYLGGAADDRAYAVAVDGSGRAIVAGSTFSTDFPLKKALDGTGGGTSSDIFLTRLSEDGSSLNFSTYFGGSLTDTPTDLVLDGDGNIVLVGLTNSDDFPLLDGFRETVDTNFTDGFLSRISSNGSTLLYSTFFGGTGPDEINAVDVAPDGSLLIAGKTSSNDLPLQNPLQMAKAYGEDAFAARLSANGASLLYSTYLGGDGNDAAYGIRSDSDGKAYVGGQTISTDLPVSGAVQPSKAGGIDLFVTRLTSAGSIDFLTYFGGSANDEFGGMDLASDGTIWFAGRTQSTDFPEVAALQFGFGGDIYDATVTQVTANGSKVKYSSYLGGNQDDYATGVYGSADGSVSIVGYTEGGTFPLVNAAQTTAGGAYDTFVIRVAGDAVPDPYSFADTTGAEPGQKVSSEKLKLTGFDVGTPVTVSGGKYRIDDGAWTNIDGVLEPGSKLQLQAKASDEFDGKVKVDVTVGGVPDTWKLTTRSIDQKPDAFAFADVENANPGAKTKSDKLILSGFDAPLSVSISGGSYRVNGGDWTQSPGTIAEGDEVQLKAKSSSTAGETVKVKFTAGERSDTWKITTAAGP